VSDCPSCGRYVGPHESCPYCGAVQSPRLSLVYLKYGSLVLALVGLAILLFFAGRNPVPLYTVAELGPSMNYAYLRLAGTVSRQPSYDVEDGSLSFWLEDGSGELFVGLYEKEARVLLAAGNAPQLGDQVQVDGTLRVREDFTALTVNVPESVIVTRPEPELVQIGQINRGWEGQLVQVMGVVRQVRQPYASLTVFTLRDNLGAVEVAVSQDVLNLTGDLDPDLIASGRSLLVAGVVTLYNDEPQLVLTDVAGLAPAPAPIEFATGRSIGDLRSADAGYYARIFGIVSEVDPFSAGVKLTLDDRTGAIIVLLWQDLADLIGEHTIFEPGMQMGVVGEIAEYRGELEIIPELVQDIQLAGRVELPTPSPAAVLETAATLVPDTAATTLVVTPSPIPTAAPSPAAVLETTVTPVPNTATPIPVVTPSPTPTATPDPVTPLDQLGVMDLGLSRTVEATVVEASSFSAGFKFLLDDGTGQIELLLWTDQYAELAQRASLRPGAELRVTGEVGQYEGELQLELQPDGLLVLAAGSGPRTDLVATGQVGEFLGQMLAVQGQVVRLETFSGDNGRLILDDGSGEVQVILWSNVLALVPAELLAENVSIQVIGMVGEYQGTMQITPALPVYLTPLDE